MLLPPPIPQLPLPLPLPMPQLLPLPLPQPGLLLPQPGLLLPQLLPFPLPQPGRLLAQPGRFPAPPGHCVPPPLPPGRLPAQPGRLPPPPGQFLHRHFSLQSDYPRQPSPPPGRPLPPPRPPGGQSATTTTPWSQLPAARPGGPSPTRGATPHPAGFHRFGLEAIAAKARTSRSRPEVPVKFPPPIAADLAREESKTSLSRFRSVCRRIPGREK